MEMSVNQLKAKLAIRLIIFLLLVMTLCINVTYGQTAVQKNNKGNYSKALTPARGHYKQLASFSPAPKSPDEDIDKKKFITPLAAIDKRLSLKPIYLTDVSADDFKLPDPPANSSMQTRAELNYLVELEKNRTEEDIRRCHFMSGIFYNLNIHPGDSTYEQNRKNLFYVGRSIGTWFNPQTLPLTADLMANVWRDANYFIWALKYKYARIRPYILAPKLKNLEEAGAPSYPTGTATDSYIQAYVFQELAPQFTDIFVSDAYDMSLSRETIEVHYPSDVEGSRILARQFVNKLFQNKKFLSDFENVKKEWASKARESIVDQ
jgi:acid phosphatase (class A)